MLVALVLLPITIAVLSHPVNPRLFADRGETRGLAAVHRQAFTTAPSVHREDL
jgi:hypothetical protein